MLTLLPLLAAAAGPPGWALTAGPSSLFVLPGIAAECDRVVAPRVAVDGQLTGEALDVAGRVGVRLGADVLPLDRGLYGWFIGPRLGAWALTERAGATAALTVGALAGYRWVSDPGLVLAAGLGVTRHAVVGGDSSFSRTLPALELRVGRAWRNP